MFLLCEKLRKRITSTTLAGSVALTLASPGVNAQADIDKENFELGVFTGIINIGDFGSEWLAGISANFQASENFFLQYNYLQADAGLSSFEESQGRYFSGSDRNFVHYDLLVGYKLFQAEVYPREGKANLSSFYLVGGVGETRFGDEENFTITAGIGYELALTRDLIVRADYRNYIYESSLIRDEEETVQSAQFSIGLGYLF
ncbi:outer membrane beta-barrel domain-containing protein [Proteobacteria bacterium 005FR1]|nr:outer membrane beta-barrel domain-containing protein [Proteobacteria bacterium 005FR1]